MTRNGHLVGGGILAVGASSIFASASLVSSDALHLLAFGLSVLLGSTAPDWLEIAWYDYVQKRRVSVIPHRTVTHWLLMWIGVFVWSLQALTEGDTSVLILVGFSLGAVLHCVQDWMTPYGVPIFLPFLMKNHSLKKVRTVRGEMTFNILLAIVLFLVVQNFSEVTYFVQELISPFI